LMRKGLDLQRAEDLQVLNYAISTALRRCNLFELHSGAVNDPLTQRGVLLAGASGSGKSTLTLQLVANGWRYSSDDVVFLKYDGSVLKACPLRRAFAVTKSTVEAGGERVREAFATAAWPPGSKGLFIPEEVFPNSFSVDCEPRAIFFPAITNAPNSEVNALTAGETMIQLIKLCPWSCYDPVTSKGHLDVLASLLKQCRGFRLLAGRDLLSAPARASALVNEHMASVN